MKKLIKVLGKYTQKTGISGKSKAKIRIRLILLLSVLSTALILGAVCILFVSISSNKLLNSKAMMSSQYDNCHLLNNDNNILIINRDIEMSQVNDNNEENRWSGYNKSIQPYSTNSSPNKDEWTIAVVIPGKNIISSITWLNIFLLVLLFVLIITVILLSASLISRYSKPIAQEYEHFEDSDLIEAPKSNAYDIDDLICFLSNQNTHEDPSKKAEDKKLPLPLIERFIENTKSLSPAEQAVFDLYVKGYTAKEISEILYLSINTIKTHNRHIYAKLNVASRHELLVYIRMLKDMGRIPE